MTAAEALAAGEVAGLVIGLLAGWAIGLEAWDTIAHLLEARRRRGTR